MASSRVYSFRTFSFFCVLLQQSIQNCNANQGCVEPQFGAQQKITIDLYFGYDDNGDEADALCKIINGSNGLISIVYRMGADTHVGTNGKVICDSEGQCSSNRTSACYYKYYKDIYNDCNKNLPPNDPKVPTCIGNADADDILVQNRSDYEKSKATVLPAMVVNQIFDPCFTTYTYDFMKTYLCKAYKNALPVCST